MYMKNPPHLCAAGFLFGFILFAIVSRNISWFEKNGTGGPPYPSALLFRRFQERKAQTWLRSRSQLGKVRALMLETMPMAANKVMIEEPP